MDPYLEAAALWPGVHGRLITHLGDLLSAGLDGSYFVDIEQRVYVVGEDDPAQRLLRPDLVVSATTPTPPTSQARGAFAAGAKVLWMVEDDIEVSEPRLLVHDRDAGAVVTVIEVLSPTNKLAGSSGRGSYLDKRREVLRSQAHFIEIDLLRDGLRFPSVEPLPPGDYYAHVSRVPLRPRGEVHAWRVRDPLPGVPVPLRAGAADARLDLGEALRRTYDQARYDRRIDYGAPPPPPALAPADAAWLDERLRAAGKRA